MSRRPFTRAAVLAIAIGIGTQSTPARADATACESSSESAQRLRLAHSLIAARTALVACAQDACPAVIRRDCEKWLVAVEATVPSVVVAPRDGRGRDLINVRVEIDGATVLEKIDGVAIDIDPGPHVFRFTEGGKTHAETVVIHEGVKGRLLVVALEPPLAETPSAPGPAAAQGLTTPAPPSRVPAYVFGGVGLAAIAAWGVFGLLGLNDYGRLQDSCGDAHTCGPSDLSGARTKFLVADVALGIGVVSLAAATYLFLSSHPTPR